MKKLAKILILTTVFFISKNVHAQLGPNETFWEPITIEYDLNKFPFANTSGSFWNNNSLIINKPFPSLNLSYELTGMIRDVEKIISKITSGVITNLNGDSYNCYRLETRNMVVTIPADPTNDLDIVNNGRDESTLAQRRNMVLIALSTLEENLKMYNLDLKQVCNITVTINSVRSKNTNVTQITYSYQVKIPVPCSTGM